MICGVCHDSSASSIKSVCEKGQMVDLGCDRCAGIQPAVHDVFFKHPYKSEALGVEFTSKAQKAAYLKEHGLSEAGDMKLGQKSWIDGSREYRKRNFEESRPVIKETYKRYLDNVRRKR